MPEWPASEPELEGAQVELARLADDAEPWRHSPGASLAVAGVFFASPHGSPGVQGEPVWAAAALWQDGGMIASAVVAGRAGHGYVPGYLALREGPPLERAVRGLDRPPDVVLSNASGRDHPRRAGLAVHLGAILGVPTFGVTDRPLIAEGLQPDDERGAAAPLTLDGEHVGYQLRTRKGARPVCVHAAWRTDPDTAREVAMSTVVRARTPEPLRRARFLARVARARAEGRLPPRWRQLDLPYPG